MPTHHLTSKSENKVDNNEICLFAQTNFRNQMRRFGIKTDDRRRHMYVIGKTGMGKTTLMENMVLSDIYNGHGVGIVDPHGDFAEKIINYVPSHRINDIVYINPSDTAFPIGFNILEVKSEEQKHLIAAGLMATFKKIWPDVWSSRMEYILNNTLLALLDYPGSTLLGINRMLGEKAYRKKVVRKLTDPVVKSFWQNEFENYEPRYQKEAVAPIQNKIGQFLSASVIRNMVAQVKSTINIRDLMDSKKIIVMNLSKGRIGEDNCRLLGGMLVTKIQLAAMERVDTAEEDRKDFFLYVDEFQNFATPSFANILSEARKYRLSIIMAHQYVAQLDEVVADAVFGNVGSIVTFRVGGADAETLTKEFTPTFMEEDIVNLTKFTIILKLMIDGVASQPFTANTMPPIGSPTGSAQKVIKVSRERYGRPRNVIEEKILRWSGMGELIEDDEFDVDTTKEDTSKEKKDKKESKKNDKKSEKKSDKKSSDESKDTTSSDKPKKDHNEKEKTISFKEAMSDEDRKALEQAVQKAVTTEDVSKEEKADVEKKDSEHNKASEDLDMSAHAKASVDKDKRKEEIKKELTISYKPEEESKKDTHNETKQNNSTQHEQSDASSEEPKKKKRKRKRRRKRKNKNTEESNSQKQDSAQNSKQKNNNSGSDSQKIDPDQVITFD